MVNPDGVVIGNSRVSVKGVDLNRSWEFCDENNYPEIYCIKQRIQSLNDSGRSVYMFLDLHGHSTKTNSFALCTLKEDTSNFEWAKVRLFPKIIAENCKFFDMNSCQYSFLPTEKNCCAREVAWRDLKVEHSYTLETSFFGSNNVFQQFIPGEVQNFDPEDTSIKHFSVQDYEYIGQQFCKSILQFSACVTLMIEQTFQNENVDITEEQLLNGQADLLDIPFSELVKLNDLQYQRRITTNISNVSDNSMLQSQTLIKGQNGKESSPQAKPKKNLKSTSIAISKMLKLNQMLSNKEKGKGKDGQLFSDQRPSQYIESLQTKFDEFDQSKQLEVLELQATINNQDCDLSSDVNCQIDQMVTSTLCIEENKKELEEKKYEEKKPEEKKQPNFMLLQKQQTKIQKNISQASINNISKVSDKLNLNKFQQYVLKNKDQIKVLFSLKNGLDWHKFYDNEDIEDLREFKEQQIQNKNANTIKQSSKSQYKINMTESGESLPTESNNNKSIFYQKEENNESDSEPEDDIIKKYRKKGKDGKYEEGEFDGEDESQKLIQSQKQMKEIQVEVQVEKEQSKKKIKTKSQSSFCENSDEQGNKLSEKQNKLQNKHKLGRGNLSIEISVSDQERQGLDQANQLNKNGQNYSSVKDLIGRNKNHSTSDKNENSKSANKILLPTTQFIISSPKFSKFVPFNEKIKLKSPFLPTQNEIIEAYSIKSPNNIRSVTNKKLLSDDSSLVQSQLLMSANLSTHQQPYINNSHKLLNSEENENALFKQTSSSRAINFGSLFQQELNLSQSVVKRMSSVLSSVNNSPTSKRKVIPSTDNIIFNPANDHLQEDNKAHDQISQDNNNLNEQDKEEQASQQDYIVESSELIPSKNMNLRLDFRSHSMQSDSLLQRSPKAINNSMKDACTTSIGAFSSMQNSIYGGLIAMQESNSLKIRQRQNSMLMKISVSSTLNSPLSSAKSQNSSLQKTVVTYRPLTGNKSFKIQKDMNSPKFLNSEDTQSITPSSYFNSLPVSPKMDSQNCSFTPQPSFRIKQQNLNKLYKSFVEQQQQIQIQKEQKQQEQAQKSLEKQNSIKKPQTPTRSLIGSPTSLSSSQNIFRSSLPNFRKGVFQQNS